LSADEVLGVWKYPSFFTLLVTPLALLDPKDRPTFYETLVNLHQSGWRNIAEDVNIQ
jgi:hypothetical protein